LSDRLKLLLIEDHPDTISISKQVFVPEKYDLNMASNGAEGLKLMQKIQPDTVILDFLLPDMNAAQFMVALSEHNFKISDSCFFFLLTAWNIGGEEFKLLFSHGLDFYLRKPFGYSELKIMIEGLEVRKKIHDQIASENKLPGSLAIKAEKIRDLADSIIGISESLLERLRNEVDCQAETELTAIQNCGMKLLREV